MNRYFIKLIFKDYNLSELSKIFTLRYRTKIKLESFLQEDYQGTAIFTCRVSENMFDSRLTSCEAEIMFEGDCFVLNLIDSIGEIKQKKIYL